MISFTICLLVLVAGYFVYGRFVERVFGPDNNRLTPALTRADGVDYIPLPAWKIFMIQFLNIAGLGPIFGAIMGAKFGTASYLWIVLCFGAFLYVCLFVFKDLFIVMCKYTVAAVFRHIRRGCQTS